MRYVQNPALGAILLWRFVTAYSAAHKTSDAPILPLAFVVLPILLHHETFAILKATQRLTGLHGFVDKFSRSGVERSDLLLAIHSRAESMRYLTIESLQEGVRHSLLSISTTDATLVALSTTRPSGLASSVRPLLDGAEKFGMWCAQLTPFEIATALKVGL
ncbi:three component ABC system middle component [Planctellipticum variicoloris]|uniref:three component ABC system middle component n=1 Tax=Planctellipticum variicoloris TaxID=3064265 RepID=UPI003AF739B3